MVDRSCIAHISFDVVSNCHQITHLIIISLLRLLNYDEKICNVTVVISIIL